MNDTHTRIRALLNESIDVDLGPRRPAPAFNSTPPVTVSPHRTLRISRWVIPLLAAASVAVVLGGTIALANRHGSGPTPLPPATLAPAPSHTQIQPPTHPTQGTTTAHQTSTHPTQSTTTTSQTPRRGADVLNFGGYGPVDLGMTAAQLAALEPNLNRNTFGVGCTQFFDHAPGQVGGPMFNVLLTPPTNRVIGISVPARAVADANIKVGSTRGQIAVAYPGKHIEETNSQAGTVVLVQGSNSWMGFLLDQSGTVKSMSVGSRAFAAQQELCVGG